MGMPVEPLHLLFQQSINNRKEAAKRRRKRKLNHHLFVWAGKVERTAYQPSQSTTMNRLLTVANEGSWSKPLLLSVLAGASTSLGAAVVLVRRSAPLRKAHLAMALSLAGGVMINVSLFSLLPESLEGSDGVSLDVMSYSMLERLLSFVVGCVLYYMLSKCAFPEPETILGFEEDKRQSISSKGKEESVPFVDMTTSPVSRKTSLRIRSQASSNIKDEEKAATNPSTPSQDAVNKSLGTKLVASSSTGTDTPSSASTWWSSYSSGNDLASADARRAWRVSLILFVSLIIHNFPEGLAVAASSMHSPHLGLTTAVAIGLHNIPEGIAIAVPCLAARPDSPYLAFGLASLSGLTEPLGALVALTILQVDVESMGNWLSFVASIMISVAVLELFPEAWRNAVADDAKSAFWIGAVVGVVVMIGSDAVLDQSLEE
eukprot:scaffold1814_cov163-Amphora_coffeaeformis.AAC.3